MKVLLTGSAGFIGTAIGQALAEAGDEVVRVDVMLPDAHGTADAPEGTHRLDVRDAASWTDLLRGVDAVCHQAALVGLGVRVADLPAYASHNDLGTAALLAAMHDAGVSRLVLASSMVIYGEGRYVCPDHGPQAPGVRSQEHLTSGRFENPCPVCGTPLGWDLVTEDAPLDPRSSYAASKVAQEHYATAWARQSGGSVTSLRYHNVYGPSMPRDTPYAGVAAIFRSALEAGRAPRVFEDGGQQRDFVHVTDVGAANLRALLADPPESSLRAYNVASGRPHTVGDMARALADAFGGPAPVVTGDYRIGDVRHVVASPLRAEEELGFRAEVEFADGMRAFATDPLR